MSNVSMKAMLEAGVHFGHQTSRWNPKMSRFIFGERNGVHILDLQKTAKELKKACAFVKEGSKKGAKFLFVGTKKQAQEAIKAEAERCGAYCISEKWLGGTLTNFQTVKKSIERMNELEKWESSGVFKAISRKEASRLTKELNRLQKLLGGIRDMKVLPDIVFVIDPVDTMGVVRESHVLGIPVVAVCDTNADPDLITIPVPGNDDAARSIKLFCGAIADSILEGKAEPDYARCVAISTKGAQHEMLLPSILAIIVPIGTGLLLGVSGVLGLLIGGLATGFVLAVFMANAGGAWDNAKKYVEEGHFGGKGSDCHKATVVGDTVGDPFKDTSGPSLNILIKLMSMVSIVMAGLTVAYHLL